MKYIFLSWADGFLRWFVLWPFRTRWSYIKLKTSHGFSHTHNVCTLFFSAQPFEPVASVNYFLMISQQAKVNNAWFNVTNHSCRVCRDMLAWELSCCNLWLSICFPQSFHHHIVSINQYLYQIKILDDHQNYPPDTQCISVYNVKTRRIIYSVKSEKPYFLPL